MYLKKLHISNFRCFRDYTIEFAPGVTVLFGKNGSGKSTLIHAIHKALSFAFKKACFPTNLRSLTPGSTNARVMPLESVPLFKLMAATESPPYVHRLRLSASP